ncbi:MAG: OmpA family protein [Granulosicoccus sp.]
MNRKICTLSSIAGLLMGGSMIVNAHDVALPGTIEIPAGTAGYVNVGGNALRTGGGECLKLGSFSEENQVNACEGIEETAEVAAETETETETEEAPAAEPAPAPEPVAKEPIVTTATLGGEALFDSNSAELNAASEQALDNLVAELRNFQEITAIEVTGHSDSSGDETYNKQLSEQRAAAVDEYLMKAFPNASVTSRGLGESSPIATNSTVEGRKQNRRVEVQVTAKSITE